jgi:hypothetical protein
MRRVIAAIVLLALAACAVVVQMDRKIDVDVEKTEKKK